MKLQAEVKSKKKFVLTLNEEELDALTSILGHIAGDPKKSPRKHFDSLAQAIDRVAGIHYSQTNAHALLNISPAGTGFTFNNYEDSE